MADNFNDEDGQVQQALLPVAAPAPAPIPSSIDELKEAQQRRNVMQLIAGLGQASSTVGSALAQSRGAAVAPDNFYSNLAKQGDQYVEDVKSKQSVQHQELANKQASEQLKNEVAKQDPNSDISKIGREILKHSATQAGISLNLPEKMSLSNMEKILPGIENMANKRIQMMAVQGDRQTKADAKEEEKVNKMIKSMGEDLDPNKPRTGEFGKNQARINAAERLETLLNQFPDGNIPKIQMRELSTSVAALLSSGSQTAVHQINELVPKTMVGDASSIAEWVTGNPTGTQQKAFVRMFADTAAREKETAQNQMTSAQFQKAYSTHQKLKEKSPEEFYRNLSVATKLDPEEIKKMEAQPGFKGNFTPKQTVKSHQEKTLTAKDQQAIDWANNNKGDPRAKAILKLHGLQ